MRHLPTGILLRLCVIQSSALSANLALSGQSHAQWLHKHQLRHPIELSATYFAIVLYTMRVNKTDPFQGETKYILPNREPFLSPVWIH